MSNTTTRSRRALRLAYLRACACAAEFEGVFVFGSPDFPYLFHVPPPPGHRHTRQGRHRRGRRRRR